MASFVTEKERVESSSEKKVRIFLAVMYFIQVLIMAAFPIMYGPVNEDGQYSMLTAVNLLIQPNGYNDFSQGMTAIYGIVLVVFPIIAFFFFLLDKRSKKKYVVSYITCIFSAIILCFGPGGSIAFGGIFALIVIIIIMFMTTQGFQATRMRERQTAAD